MLEKLEGAAGLVRNAIAQGIETPAERARQQAVEGIVVLKLPRAPH